MDTPRYFRPEGFSVEGEIPFPPSLDAGVIAEEIPYSAKLSLEELEHEHEGLRLALVNKTATNPDRVVARYHALRTLLIRRKVEALFGRAGTFQHTDGTGIPALVTLTPNRIELNRAPGIGLTAEFEKCGMRFGTLFVYGYALDSPLPVVRVERFFGADLVRRLLDHVEGKATLASGN